LEARLGLHGEDADDRERGADGGDEHRGDDGFEGGHRIADLGECGGAERGGGEDGADVGFVKVGAHAGDVADVVTDVVGDGGGVARIVLRDACLDFADEVGADVGGLGEDAAADAGEEGLQRGAHAEGQHRGGDDEQLVAGIVVFDEGVENQEPERDVEQREADDDQAHHRAAAEREFQGRIEGLAGRRGRRGRRRRWRFSCRKNRRVPRTDRRLERRRAPSRFADGGRMRAMRTRR
jgi:hypothetical protein